MKWVIEASIAAKWLGPEIDSALAVALLDDELLAPDLLYPEVANILWKKRFRAELDAAAASAGARWLLHAPIQVHACAELTTDALYLATHVQHTAYDCFYLALARLAKCPFVTADRRLFERCQRTDTADLAATVVLLPDAAMAARR
jgi:predicted nucleic acid-binding protein